MTGPFKEEVLLNPNQRLMLRRNEELMDEAFMEFFDKIAPLLEDASETELEMMADHVESALGMLNGYHAEKEVFEYPKEVAKETKRSIGQAALREVKREEDSVQPQRSDTPRHIAFRGITGVPC